MPRGFSFPDKCELWLPAGWMGVPMDRRTSPWLSNTRLRRNVSSIRPGAGRHSRQIAITLPDSRVSPQVKLVSLLEQTVGRVRSTLVILLGTVAFVLLIACGNVANLLLAKRRATARDQCAAPWRQSHVGYAAVTLKLVVRSPGWALAAVAFWGIRLLRCLARRTFRVSPVPP
jgi:hypothetical protein